MNKPLSAVILPGHPMDMRTVQQWMQTYILNPPARHSLAVCLGAFTNPSSLIRESATLSAEERLDIYRRTYWLRIEDAVAGDYPALKHLMGARRFSRLVRRYVSRRSPTGYTLDEVGAGLPEFISERSRLALRACYVDLARFERAVAQVFMEDTSQPLTEEMILSVPDQAWESARLIPIRALRLVESDYPVNRYFESVRRKQLPPSLRRQKTWTAVYRPELIVKSLELTRRDYDMLESLVIGQTVGDIVRATLIERRRARTDYSALFTAFRRFMTYGLFQRIDVARR